VNKNVIKVHIDQVKTQFLWSSKITESHQNFLELLYLNLTRLETKRDEQG
jgi:hypothetical protein